MTFSEYQTKALTTALRSGNDLYDTLHWVLGICGEAGEVAEKIKKIIRDKNGVISDADKQELSREIGDVLWYLAILSKQLGQDFEEVAQANLDKLRDRKVRNKLRGSGDNR